MIPIPMWNSALLVFGDYKVVTKLTIVYLSIIQWFYFGNLHKFRKNFIRHQRVCLGELLIFNKIATFVLLCYFLLFESVNTCVPRFVILFLYSYETDFMKGLAGSFNFTFRYMDDVLLLNNSKLCYNVDYIYHIFQLIRYSNACSYRDFLDGGYR